jgi:hypothetical protein
MQKAKKKSGLFEGRVFREPGFITINRRPVGEAAETVMQPPDVAIERGDSGGVLWVIMLPINHWILCDV